MRIEDDAVFREYGKFVMVRLSRPRDGEDARTRVRGGGAGVDDTPAEITLFIVTVDHDIVGHVPENDDVKILFVHRNIMPQSAETAMKKLRLAGAKKTKSV